VPINPDAVGSTGEPAETSWTSKDALLYAVGVGAGQDPLDPAELPFVTENSMEVTQRVLPTFAVVLPDVTAALGTIGSFNPVMLVHGEERVHLHREIPVRGAVTTVAEVTAVWDKGSGAVVEITSRSNLVEDGEPLFEVVMSAFIRGEGGWGGERGPSAVPEIPEDRDPDVTVTWPTRPEQALVYRLSGDRNPLHSDPSFAAMAGFDRPILHGLCTYGFTGRALLRELCDSDPSRFESISGRFSSPVLPGEDLTVQIWRSGDARAAFRTLGGDGRTVLDAGVATTRD
jgi:acyl dehydratase